MKNLSLWLAAFLLMTACAQPGKETSSPGPAIPQPSSEARAQAQILSQAYRNWQRETARISWQSTDPVSFELAQAYVLALRSQRDLGTSNIEVVVWLLESFKNVNNPSADSAEMIALAEQYLKRN